MAKDPEIEIIPTVEAKPKGLLDRIMAKLEGRRITIINEPKQEGDLGDLIKILDEGNEEQVAETEIGTDAVKYPFC
ncbi:MAG: hypothetical protein GF390_02290 [Candidatus Pacebacteria bacterium]|nr:hypothetical protein [Candidatus Paceibacterota bacterium]